LTLKYNELVIGSEAFPVWKAFLSLRILIGAHDPIKISHMNITLSVPEDIAWKAKLVAARRGETLSSWLRQQVARELEAEEALREIAVVDSETAAAVGCALSLEEHWEDTLWRALVEKHLQ
jgi:hypothetical protein